MNLLRRKKINKKYTQLVDGKNKTVKDAELGLLTLKRGETYQLKVEAGEVLLTVLTGSIRFTDNDISYTDLGSRKNVFEGKAFSVYVRAKKETYVIKAEKNCEVVVAGVKIAKNKVKDNKVIVIPPKDVKTKMVGKRNYKRNVHTIVSPEFDAVKIVAGETFNPEGNWSSIPPHTHEKKTKNQSLHKEIYFYRCLPKDGYGVQLVYDDKKMDEIYKVKHNDAVLIPKGYHPVVSVAGTQLYYFWVLIGQDRKVMAVPHKSFKHID